MLQDETHALEADMEGHHRPETSAAPDAGAGFHEAAAQPLDAFRPHQAALSMDYLLDHVQQPFPQTTAPVGALSRLLLCPPFLDSFS
jgi:hypothetical protein